MLQKLSNQPCVVQPLDVCKLVDGGVCIVMEKAVQDLFSVVEGGKLHECKAVYFMSQLLGVVGVFHAMGIVHRDLKLENILIFDDGTLKPCDLDLACFLEPTINDTDSRGGSQKYAASELFDKNLLPPAYDGRAADAWSGGGLWFVMKAGYFPWVEATVDCLMFRKHMQYAYPWPCDNNSDVDMKMRQSLSIQIPKRLPLPETIECTQYATLGSSVA